MPMRAGFNPFEREPEVVYVSEEKPDHSKHIKIAAGVGAVGLLLFLLFKSRGGGVKTGGNPPSFRIDASGLTYQGKPIDVARAMELAMQGKGATLLITGDARQGDVDAVITLFKGRGIPLVIASPGQDPANMHVKGIHAGATSLPFPDHIERAKDAARMSRWSAQAAISPVGKSLYRRGCY